ncbi:MAG: EpsG family protein [Clostridia bacterium]|nr:EpsG family protein [Clostridia bacterium]
MWPYALLIMIPIIVRHVRVGESVLYLTKQSKTKDENVLKLFWGMLLALLMLRHEVIGSDTQNYNRIFRIYAQSSWRQTINRSAEIAYSILNKLVSLCTDNFRWILAICAVLGVYAISKAYVKYSKDAVLTIALFITTSNFVMLFSGLRQGIAISLGFVAFEFVRQKKLVPFLLVVYAAMLFHTSAFMLLFMYPLYHLKITRPWLLVVVPLMGLLFIFNAPVFSYLTAIMSRFTEYEAEISSTGAYTMLILYGMLAIFSYIIPDEQKMRQDPDAMGFRNFLLFSVALQMFAPLHTLAMRMNYYYMAFIPLALPKVIGCTSRRWRQVAAAARYIMVAFFVFYFFWSVPSDNPLNIYPYHFFWEMV